MSQLAATREAIGSLRLVAGGSVSAPAGHGEAPVRTKGRRVKVGSAPKPARRPRKDKGLPLVASTRSDAEVRAALLNGPLSPAAFDQALGLSRYLSSKLLIDLEARGIVRVTGTTSTRRIALAGKAPAKEVP